MARFEAAGKKLSPEEKAKRDEHPFDAYARFKAESAKGQFPKGVDNFRWRFHGLFYVAPTQNSYMCRLRIPNGILTHWQLAGVADLAERYGGGYAHVTTRANLQIRDVMPEGAIPLHRGAGGPRHHHQRDGCRQHPQRHRLAHGRHRPAGAARHPSLCPRLAPPHPQRPLALRPAAQVQRRLRRRRRHPRAGGHQRHRLHGRDGGARARAWSRASGSGSASAASPGHQDFAKYGGVYVKPDEAVAVADAIVRVFIDQRRPHRPQEGAPQVRARRLGPRQVPRRGRGEARPPSWCGSPPTRCPRPTARTAGARRLPCPEAGRQGVGRRGAAGRQADLRADARPRQDRARAGRRRYPPHRLAEPADLRHRRRRTPALVETVPAPRSASPPRPPACAPG